MPGDSWRIRPDAQHGRVGSRYRALCRGDEEAQTDLRGAALVAPLPPFVGGCMGEPPTAEGCPARGGGGRTGLLTKLQRSLEEDPDLRRFQVRTPGAFTIFDSSAAPAIIYLHEGDGALGDWVARHADGLFRRVPDKSSPPVYEMSEELVRYLNGPGHY